MNRRRFLTLTGALGASLAVVATPSQAASRLSLPANPRVLVLGDSYTEGLGADPLTNGWAYLIGAPLVWQVTVDGKGGSGYANPTTYGAGTFAQRLNKRLSTYPTVAYDLIVLQGSSNDQKYLSTLAADIKTTIRKTRKLYPSAQILMLGPTTPYGNPGPDLLAVNDRLKRAASTYKINFINPLGEKWFVPGDGSWAANPTNGHPNNAGHAHIAQRFVEDVKVLTS